MVTNIYPSYFHYLLYLARIFNLFLRLILQRIEKDVAIDILNIVSQKNSTSDRTLVLLPKGTFQTHSQFRLVWEPRFGKDQSSAKIYYS